MGKGSIKENADQLSLLYGCYSILLYESANLMLMGVS